MRCRQFCIAAISGIRHAPRRARHALSSSLRGCVPQLKHAMYLSKLTMHGFKSFAQQTELKFDPGVTAVVGPNGCGKSNIVDAVRWVTGEQRSRILRSEKMDSVIFNGTARRRPLGMAEVTLTIENTRGVLPTEYAEVTIGRRLYRSGESEYLLNGVQCRLKDILDLFMDTGMGPGAYSVIELKMIEEILSENTQERRHLFEEAAGITKYKLRRTQALRKLDSTQANLTRIRDLTDEIGKRVQTLKGQAEKAAQAREVQVRLRELELSLAQIELNRLRSLEEKLSKETQQLKDQIDVHTAEESREEADMEALRVELVGQEKTLSARQQDLNQHLDKVRSLETERRLALERMETAHRNLERAHREQEEEGKRIHELQEQVEKLKIEMTEAQPVLERARKVAADAKVESEERNARAKEAWKTAQSLRETEEAAERTRLEQRRTLDRLASRIELVEQDLVGVHEQAAALEQSVADALGKRDQFAATLGKQKQQLEQSRLALSEAERIHGEAQQKHEKGMEDLRRIERQFDAVSAEVQLLESLISSYEDLSEAAQYLAENTGWTRDELTTVADVIGAEEEHSRALDAALGAYASCIVVKTEAEARQAITLLRNEQKGRTNIIVLSRLKKPMHSIEIIEEAADRGARPMTDIARVREPAYQTLCDTLLHNCFLVNSLEHGQDLLDTMEEMATMLYDTVLPLRYYAPSGEWLDARGIICGGSTRGDDSVRTGRLQRREQYDAAVENLKSLEAALNQKQRITQQLREALASIPVDERRQALRQVEQQYNEAERMFSRVQHEHASADQRREELADRIAHMMETVSSGRTQIASLQEPVKEMEAKVVALRAERGAAEEAFRAAEADNREALNKYNDANLAAVQARNHFDNVSRDLERSKQDIAHLQGRQQAREQHVASLKKIIEDNLVAKESYDLQIKDLYALHADLEAAVSEAEQDRAETQERIRNLELRLRALRQSREQGLREETQRAVRLTEVQTRAIDLVKKIEEDFERSLIEDPVTVAGDFDDRNARQEVQSLRARLRAMGSINELALESYEEEKERFEFMSAQRRDLEEAEQTLLDTITEINVTAAACFDETFQEVRRNFAHLFSTLFGKDDTADLLLSDPNDPLESPIEIVAKPKGKRPSAISQLSGGEKTLTATALLFAIYLVKPSPFCILDEVDAPLDEANVERFMQLIREFSNNTQFILVTHNRRTMELADRLYGITMQEQGVSKLVGVKFDERVELTEEQ
ncbi:MAG: chromosome segregation protein SMC [Rhodothermales bacterium]